MWDAAKIGISAAVPYGSLITTVLDPIVKSINNSNKKSEEEGHANGMDSSIQLVTKLRHDLGQVVKEIISATESKSGFKGPERIVIYIDDLDRLEPERAVTVMEAIKVFLDIEDCVFVLAIDFGVVLRGVRAKYGDDFSEDKARAFFDKIIQVPFNLPLGAYQVDNLLKDGLRKIDVDISEGIEDFCDLTSYSAGSNPRSIKRLINTFGLIKMIGKKLSERAPQNANQQKVKDVHVFAVLCLQTVYPQIFDELVRALANENLIDKWDEIKGVGEQENDAEPISEKYGISEYQLSTFKQFVGKLGELFETGSETHARFNEDLFSEALSKAAVTAVSTSEGVQTASAGRGAPIMDADSRMKIWDEHYPQKNNEGYSTKELAHSFEQSLKEVLGEDLEAGVCKDRHWSYVGHEQSRLPKKIQELKFLELHPRKGYLQAMFGKYLSDKDAHAVLEDMGKFEEVEAKHLPKSSPQFSINKIRTPEQAAYAAKLIGEAYLKADK